MNLKIYVIISPICARKELTMKVFASNNIRNAKGLVLPYDSFKLFRDVSNPAFEPEKLKRIVAEAERFLDKDIPLLRASVYREYVTNGNRSNYEAVYFMRRDMAVNLALAEAYEKKGRFTEKLMDVVWAIMEESTWVIPAHLYNSGLYSESSLGPVFGDNALHGMDLFSAATCGSLSCVYHLCKDILDKIDPIISSKMHYMIRERGIKNFLQLDFWWTGVRGNRTNNWCPWVVSNVLLSTALVEEDLYLREKIVTKSIECLDNFLNWYKPDGGCDEGPAYWGAAGAALFDCLELIEDMTDGKISIYHSDLVKNIGEYIYKVNINGTRYVNFADCAPKTNPNSVMLVRYGQKTGSEFLVSFGKKQAAYGDFFFTQSHMYRSMKCIYTPTTQQEASPMPLGTWLPNLEVMTARQYSDSAKGMFLAAKGGNNDEMHNHNDLGNFMVYYDSEPVIIDTGVGTYTKQTFSAQRYELWFMQSGYHNLPSFGGVDQKNGAEFKATNTAYSNHTITTELKEAYPSEAGIESYVREVGMTDGVVTVKENISLTAPTDIDFHMMTSVKPEIVKNGLISLNMGRTLEYDTALTAEVEEFDPVGMDTKHSWNTEKLYRIHFRINADKCNLVFTIK